MWQYLDPDERRAVGVELERIAAEATAKAPFAHVGMEPDPATIGRTSPRNEIRLRLAPHGIDEVLGVAPAHGVPVQWRADLLA
jgi:hypothetical protein